MSQFIVNENLIFNVIGGTGGNITITSPSDTKVKISNTGIYSGVINVQASGYQDNTGCVQSGSNAGVIIPTATKTKTTTGFVIRENDQANITCTGLRGQQACSFVITATISSAGQTKTKAK